MSIPFETDNALEYRSHSVHQYIRSHREWGTIHFTSSSGAGYFTLLAEHQGIECLNATFIVGLDILPKSTIQILESGNPQHLVTDLSILKLDFMQQKSIEYAVSENKKKKKKKVKKDRETRF